MDICGQRCEPAGISPPSERQNDLGCYQETKRASEDQRSVHDKHHIAISAQRSEARREQQDHKSQRDHQTYAYPAIYHCARHCVVPTTAKPDRRCNDQADVLANPGRDRGHLGWEKYSCKATEEDEPAHNRHQHGPVGRPDIVSAHNGKAGNEQEDARHEDERGVVRDLLRQCRKNAKVEQYSGSDRDKGGPIRQAIIFEVVMAQN
jgi:hypothetical protein